VTTPGTGLRHSARHVHRTLYDHVTSALAELEWTTTGLFSQPPLVVFDVLPKNWQPDAQLQNSHAAISIGDEKPTTDEELGGPLVMSWWPLFFDCYFEDDPVSLACANDVRDILMGRFPGFADKTGLPVYNYGVTPRQVVDGWRVYLRNVEIERVKHGWYSVICDLEVWYLDPSL
jgi:hypothetical protein